MRITLEKGKKALFCLRIPNRFLFNRFIALVAARALQKRGIPITDQQLLTSITNVQIIRTRHPDWVLLEAEDSRQHKLSIIL